MLVAPLNKKLKDEGLELKLRLHLRDGDLSLVVLDSLPDRGKFPFRWIHACLTLDLLIGVVIADIVFLCRRIVQRTVTGGLKIIKLSNLALFFEHLVEFGQFSYLHAAVRGGIDCIMDGGTDIRIALELGGLGEQSECDILMLLCGISRSKQIHDGVDALTVDLCGLGGRGGRIQELLKLRACKRVIEEGDKGVDLRIQN